MVGLLAAESRVFDQARGVAETHSDWMAWNLVLAVVPLVLAVLLFRRRARRTPAWWIGVAAFVVFLPNAPYVITDVVHLFDDIRGTRSDLMLLGVHVPLYLAFFAVGIGSYVAALELARRYLRTAAPQVRWVGVELGLHALCAAGIYLGRVMRLNSWEILTRPRAVVEAFGWLAGLAPVALVGCTAAVLVALTLLTRAVAWAAIDAYNRAGPALRTHWTH
jgi:uncharacterized membrane protein